MTPQAAKAKAAELFDTTTTKHCKIVPFLDRLSDDDHAIFEAGMADPKCKGGSILARFREKLGEAPSNSALQVHRAHRCACHKQKADADAA